MRTIIWKSNIAGVINDFWITVNQTRLSLFCLVILNHVAKRLIPFASKCKNSCLVKLEYKNSVLNSLYVHLHMWESYNRNSDRTLKKYNIMLKNVMHTSKHSLLISNNMFFISTITYIWSLRLPTLFQQFHLRYQSNVHAILVFVQIYI